MGPREMFCVTCKKEKRDAVFRQEKKRYFTARPCSTVECLLRTVESKHVEISNISFKGRSQAGQNQNNYPSCPIANLFIHLPTNLSIQPSIHLPIFSSIYQVFWPFTYPLAHPFSLPSIYPSIHPSNHPSILPSIHPPTHPPIHPDNHSSTHLSILHPIHPPTHPAIHPSTHPSQAEAHSILLALGSVCVSSQLGTVVTSPF